MINLEIELIISYFQNILIFLNNSIYQFLNQVFLQFQKNICTNTFFQQGQFSKQLFLHFQFLQSFFFTLFPISSYKYIHIISSTMKSVTYLVLAFILFSVSYSAVVGSPNDPQKVSKKPEAYDDLDKDTKFKYEKFKNQNIKAYGPELNTLRALTFSKNLLKINEHNKKNKDYTLGVTPFADLNQQQFVSLYLMKLSGKVPQALTLQPSLTAVSAVTSIDWSNRTGQVRNQGQCGSCWAFSAVGAIQINQRIKKSGSTKDYSEQQVVDCCRSPYGQYKSQGCNGGYPHQAFTYLRAGIALQSNYKYKGFSSACPTLKNLPKVIRGYSQSSGSTSALRVLASGSASVLVDASKWHLYKSGIFAACTSPISINHAVVLVGAQSGNYWKIRNSWGKLWGQLGYMRLNFINNCGLTQYIYVPTLL